MRSICSWQPQLERDGLHGRPQSTICPGAAAMRMRVRGLVFSRGFFIIWRRRRRTGSASCDGEEGGRGEEEEDQGTTKRRVLFLY